LPRDIRACADCFLAQDARMVTLAVRLDFERDIL